MSVNIMKKYPPEFCSELLGWNVQTKDEAKPPEECLVYIFKEVGCEDDDSREPLNVVQEHANINISITISRCTVK